MKLTWLTIPFCTLICLIGLSSCDPHGGYEYWIDNRSDSTLHVVYRRYNETVITVSVPDQSLRLLHKYETHNGLYDYGDDFLRFYDSIGIFIDTLATTEVQKDYSQRQSWSYRQEPAGMFRRQGENIYRLEIKNDDLQ